MWSGRGPLIQGFLGATAYDTVSRTGSNPVDVEGNSDGLDRLPLLGAGGQWKLGAEGFDYGLDGFLTAQGRSNAAATATGQTSSVPIDVDVLAIDLCAGPFLSQSLGERFRVYGGAGPLLQLAEYEQHRNTVSEHGSGLGLGAYVRGGIDWILPSRTLIGLGARWSDTRTSLSGGLGDLKMEGFQLYLTIGRSF